MGYPGSSSPGKGQGSKSSTFGRLRAAAGLGRGKAHSSAPTLELTEQDVVDAPASDKPEEDPGLSILASSVELTGSISSSTELHIHGAVDGDVRASDLTICPGGSVTGDVVAGSVLVHGTIEGCVRARKVQLCQGAVVRGDIIHTSLGIDMGSTFEGAARRSQDPLAEAKSIAPLRIAPIAAIDAARYSSPSQ